MKILWTLIIAAPFVAAFSLLWVGSAWGWLALGLAFLPWLIVKYTK